jgi:hypothetical protein
MNIVNTKYQLAPVSFQKIIAIHDFGQNYSDIYRKTFVYAKKHFDRVGYLINYWCRLIPYDKDYLVALSGLYRGLFYKKAVTINADMNISNIEEIAFLTNLSEKPVIPLDEYQRINTKINTLIRLSSLLDPVSKRFIKLIIPKFILN